MFVYVFNTQKDVFALLLEYQSLSVSLSCNILHDTVFIKAEKNNCEFVKRNWPVQKRKFLVGDTKRKRIYFCAKTHLSFLQTNFHRKAQKKNWSEPKRFLRIFGKQCCFITGNKFYYIFKIVIKIKRKFVCPSESAEFLHDGKQWKFDEKRNNTHEIVVDLTLFLSMTLRAFCCVRRVLLYWMCGESKRVNKFCRETADSNTYSTNWVDDQHFFALICV